MKRILCRIFGHKVTRPADGVDLCERCGDSMTYYEGDQWADTQRYGLIEPLRYAWYLFRRKWIPRCDHCGKRLWWKRNTHNIDFCSEECFDKWLPF